jgi:hypothetical protein
MLLTVVGIAVVPLSIGVVIGVVEVTFSSVTVMLLTVVGIAVVSVATVLVDGAGEVSSSFAPSSSQ